MLKTLKYSFPFFLLLACGKMEAQQTVGLFVNDSLSLNGYTLFNHREDTYLIDNCGFVVHTWESNYTSNTSVYLLENGNLLRTCRIPGNPFNGGGIAGRIELTSWEGELLWAHDYATQDYHNHHDVEPLPNGNFLILAWERYDQTEAEDNGRLPGTVDGSGLWPEQIVEVEMVGTDEINVVWEWRVWDHLIQDFNPAKANFGVVDEHPELINVNINAAVGNPSPGVQADWIHANAVNYNAELDQIAISSRDFSEIWVIDHSTTTEEAAGHTGGDWGKGGDLLYRFGNPANYQRGDEAEQFFYGQHDVTWLPPGHPHAGKMMVFNNGEDRFPDGANYSSVDIWEPPTDADGNYVIPDEDPLGPTELTWTYEAPGFFSGNISGAQGLPNGNILVCEGREGHLFEVTPNGEVVWDYINPVTGFGPVAQGDNIANNAVFRATRLPVDYPAFEGRDLTPTAPLELEPWPSDCEIFGENPVVAREETRLEGVWLRQNPVSDFLNLTNASGQPVRVVVSDWLGRIVFSAEFAEQNISVASADWSSGMYVLRVTNESGRRGFSEKILKL